MLSRHRSRRAEILAGRIEPFLTGAGSIVDIGSGTGHLAARLKQAGHDVTPVDVASYRLRRLDDPVMYDGVRLPFADKRFDTALLLMVLHHTSNPEAVLREASRVAHELILIETSYTGFLHRVYTTGLDAIVNLQPNITWRSYRTDAQWRRLFRDEHLRIVESKRFMDPPLFLHLLYHVQTTHSRVAT